MRPAPRRDNLGGAYIQECKPASTPVVDEPTKRPEEDEAGSLVLDPAMSTQYRALTARANYIAQDRAEIQFAVKRTRLLHAQAHGGRLEQAEADGWVSRRPAAGDLRVCVAVVRQGA